MHIHKYRRLRDIAAFMSSVPWSLMIALQEVNRRLRDKLGLLLLNEVATVLHVYRDVLNEENVTE